MSEYMESVKFASKKARKAIYDRIFGSSKVY